MLLHSSQFTRPPHVCAERMISIFSLLQTDDGCLRSRDFRSCAKTLHDVLPSVHRVTQQSTSFSRDTGASGDIGLFYYVDVRATRRGRILRSPLCIFFFRTTELLRKHGAPTGSEECGAFAVFFLSPRVSIPPIIFHIICANTWRYVFNG